MTTDWQSFDAKMARLESRLAGVLLELREERTGPPALRSARRVWRPVAPRPMMRAAGGPGLKAAPVTAADVVRQVHAPPPFDPSVGRPGYRELSVHAGEVAWLTYRAGSRMARAVARDLDLGHVGVSWYTDRRDEGGFAHRAAPNRIWVRATDQPRYAAWVVAHEGRHLRQFRDGHTGGRPDLDAPLQEDANRYAADALDRLYEPWPGSEAER